MYPRLLIGEEVASPTLVYSASGSEDPLIDHQSQTSHVYGNMSAYSRQCISWRYMRGAWIGPVIEIWGNTTRVQNMQP